jgi:hypothetical protein
MAKGVVRPPPKGQKEEEEEERMGFGLSKVAKPPPRAWGWPISFKGQKKKKKTKGL